MKKQGRLLSTNDVIGITNVARATLHRMVKRGAFPAPVELDIRRNLWCREAVNAWIADRAGARSDGC